MEFSPAITPFAFAILAFMSFVQSLFQVNRLPKYTNSVTFSITSSCTFISLSIVFLPNTIVFVLSTFIFNPARCADVFSAQTNSQVLSEYANQLTFTFGIFVESNLQASNCLNNPNNCSSFLALRLLQITYHLAY